jgi:site-specific recombinase XerC
MPRVKLTKSAIDAFATHPQRISSTGILLKVVKTFFGWCVGRAILDLSPAKGVAAPARERARDRVLDDKERMRIIQAARQIGGPMGASSNSWP